MAATSGRTFYDKQIRLLEAHDVDTLVNEQYHDDASLVSFDATLSGRDALRKHFHEYLRNLGSLEVLSTDRFTETDDAIFFEATVRTDHGIARVYDVFMLRGERATHHFTGVISLTSLEDAGGAA